MPFVKEIMRFPIKGFTGETLDHVALETGGYIPFDRAWAIENGVSDFDVEHPKFLPKTAFAMLMRHAALAKIKLTFNAKKQEVTLSYASETIAASLLTEEGHRAIEAFIMKSIGEQEYLRPLKVLKAPSNFRFMDSSRGFVSLINLATLKALENESGKKIEWQRLRGNILIDGLPEYAENDLVGQRVQIGSVIFKVLKRIERCAATTVNLETGVRDVFLPSILNRIVGHDQCGLYLEVVTAGEFSVGERFKILSPPQFDLPFA